MKKIIIFYFFLCSSLHLSAQGEVSLNTISITANFFKGDTIKYSIEEGKKKYVNDVMKDSTVLKKKMNLIVIDSTDKGFLMQIDMINDKKTDALVQDFMQDESNASFLYSFKDLKLRYRISSLGVFEGFDNMNEIKRMMSKLFDNSFQKAKIDAQRAEKAKQTFLSDQYLASTLGKYVTLLHAYHGYDYEMDTVKVFDNPLPNLFSTKGGTIPAKSEFLIEYTDSTETYAEIQQITTADKDAMKKLMKDAGNTLGFDKKVKKEMKDLEMNLFQKINCEYHVPSGVPTYFFFKKEIEVREKGKEDVNVTLDYIEINME